jgi:anti-anti-sigma factor
VGPATSPGTEGSDLGAPAVERPGAVDVEVGASALRVRLVGGIDAALARQLEAAVVVVKANQPADVRLDLADVDFLGSHGMAFLVRIQHAAHGGGRKAGIVAISHPARIALRIAGLEEFLSA